MEHGPKLGAGAQQQWRKAEIPHTECGERFAVGATGHQVRHHLGRWIDGGERGHDGRNHVSVEIGFKSDVEVGELEGSSCWHHLGDVVQDCLLGTRQKPYIQAGAGLIWDNVVFDPGVEHGRVDRRADTGSEHPRERSNLFGQPSLVVQRKRLTNQSRHCVDQLLHRWGEFNVVGVGCERVERGHQFGNWTI